MGSLEAAGVPSGPRLLPSPGRGDPAPPRPRPSGGWRELDIWVQLVTGLGPLLMLNPRGRPWQRGEGSESGNGLGLLRPRGHWGVGDGALLSYGGSRRVWLGLTSWWKRPRCSRWLAPTLGTTRPSLPTALTSAHIEGGGFSPRNRLTACWGDCGVICQEGAERSGPGALPRRPSGAEVGRPRRPPPGLGSWFCPAVWRGAMAASPRD